MMPLDIVMLESDYASLDALLKRLEQHPDIQSSADLNSQMRHVIGFHQHIGDVIKVIIEENRRLVLEIDQLKNPPTLAPEAIEFKTLAENYKRIKNTGGTPRQIYDLAKADGLDKIGCIKVLRSTFDLHLDDTLKKITEFENEDVENR